MKNTQEMQENIKVLNDQLKKEKEKQGDIESEIMLLELAQKSAKGQEYKNITQRIWRKEIELNNVLYQIKQLDGRINQDKSNRI